MVPPPAENYRVADELAAVRQLVTKMMRQQQGAGAVAEGEAQDGAASPSADLPDPLVAQYLKLLEQEVAEELADEIVRKVNRSLSDEQADDPDACKRAVHDEIARRLPTDARAGKLKPTQDGRPRIIVLVGPTGVGKTTTIAKLAATFKLKQGKQVGLITMDTFRIAAVEQLRTYAGIIGLPLKVANNATELQEALDTFEKKGMDAVLIDTAGRSQRAGERSLTSWPKSSSRSARTSRIWCYHPRRTSGFCWRRPSVFRASRSIGSSLPSSTKRCLAVCS